ncbi:MAG: hypothetical protein OS130_09880 [Thermodesulfobacteriota bacterium]|jgi:hypothetical protein|nr:MAG: hypothetical protein OS130_09880 [Thermodesulfobacteriota bacterium]
MKTDQIPPLFRLKTIYYILPFWLTAILGLGGDVISNDLGYYLKLGQAMIEKRAIISHDLFTHTFFGLQYINSGWLSQVALAVCEKMGSLESLIILRVGLLLLAMSIFYHLIQILTKHYKVTLLFIVFAAVLGFTNWYMRPQLFTIPLFVFFYRQLFQKEKIGNSLILLLSLLMILWVNLHNSFPLAIILAGIFLVGRAADEYYNRAGYSVTAKERFRRLTKDSRLRRLLFLLIMLTLVTLINPYGINIWEDVWVNASSSAARSAEWQPTAMKDGLGYCFIVSVVLAGIILKFSTRKITFTEALLLLVFLFVGFKAERMVMWWGIVSAPILAAHFCSIELVRQKISGGKKEETESECLTLNIIFFIILLITAISFLPWFRPYLPIKSVRNFINPKSEPVAIAQYIKKQGLKGNMFNDINWGSYLIWKLWPEYKVFADTRLHLVPEEIWKDCSDVHFGMGDWEKILDKYKISFVVLSKKDNKRIIEFIGDSPGWKKVYEDEAGTIFVRK